MNSNASVIAEIPTVKDYVLLTLLAAVWGASFMLIKVAVETIPAVPMTAGRLTIATIVMFALVLASRQKFPRGVKVWAMMAVVAVLGNAAPFALISWGEESVDSGLAAIMMAVMPLTTLLLAHIFTADEKLNRWKLAGVMFGFVGLVVLMGPERLLTLGDDVVRQLAIVLAAVCYGITSLVVKFIKGVPARALTAGVMLISMLIMVPFSFVAFDLSQVSPSASSIIATIILGVFQTALAGIGAYFIIHKLGATFFSQLNFIVPLFGVLFGFIFLSENPGFYALLALAIILAGIGLARYGIHKSLQ